MAVGKATTIKYGFTYPSDDSLIGTYKSCKVLQGELFVSNRDEGAYFGLTVILPFIKLITFKNLIKFCSALQQLLERIDALW